MTHFIIILILMVLAGISNAVMDKIRFHYNKSIFSKFYNQKWWNPAISWKNKYKNGRKKDGPRFFGSTTFLVFLTDAWHFFQMLFLSAMQLAIITGLDTKYSFWWLEWVVLFVILKCVFGLVFEVFYSKVFNK